MQDVRAAVALFLIVTVLAGLARIARGPTLADRILANQLFGTTGVAVWLLLGADPARASLREVALLFAGLSAVTNVAFTRLAPVRRDGRAP
jgi:multicomponent Na+:H+ antiporter subunit F